MRHEIAEMDEIILNLHSEQSNVISGFVQVKALFPCIVSDLHSKLSILLSLKWLYQWIFHPASNFYVVIVTCSRYLNSLL